MTVWPRKFVLAAYAMLSSSLLAAFSKLTGEYVTVVTIVVSAFSAADTLITRKSISAERDIHRQDEGVK